MIWLSVFLFSRVLKQRSPEVYNSLQGRLLHMLEMGRRGYHTLTDLPGSFPTTL
jgi:hypothetical protein